MEERSEGVKAEWERRGEENEVWEGGDCEAFSVTDERDVRPLTRAT